MSYSAVYLCLVALVVGHSAYVEAKIDCSNHHFRDSLIGVRSFLKYQGYAYNFGWDIEQSIATNFFDGFKAIGRLGLYLSMYDEIGEDHSDGDGGVASYVAYFKSMVTNIMKSTCEWLKTHGETFSLRQVNCTDPNEIVLLASYLGTYTDITQLLLVLTDNSCGVVVSDSDIEQYLNKTTPIADVAAKVALKGVYDDFLANLPPNNK